MRGILLTNFLLIICLAAASANEFSFPLYNYEKLIQVDREQCRININHQHIVVEKHYEADLKLLAMEWMGQRPAIDDAQKTYKNLPGLSLQNHLRHRDMYVYEKIAHDNLKQHHEMIKKLGNAAGNNYNRLQAKSSNVVVNKLMISITALENMEKALIAILARQSARTYHGSKEAEIVKDQYGDFPAGFYEATFFSEEYQRKHNPTCMWAHDRVIKSSKPFCGFVWSHGGNMYLERCPGDIHPFGQGHIAGTGLQKVKDLFNFKKVKNCPQTNQCNIACFSYCMKKNKFDKNKKSHRQELTKDGRCPALADPLYPEGIKGSSLTEKYLQDFETFPEFYPKFVVNQKDPNDVAKEIERYYLMTGEYSPEDCRSGKRKFLLELLDAVKQLISLEKNLVEYYSTSRDCYIGLAEKIETAAGVGVKHFVRDQKADGSKGGQPDADRAIVQSAGKKKVVVTELTMEEQKEAQASFFGLTLKEQDKLLKVMIENGYKFTENDIGVICQRSMKKDFCGGKKPKKK